jgi:hypothetical protein
VTGAVHLCQGDARALWGDVADVVASGLAGGLRRIRVRDAGSRGRLLRHLVECGQIASNAVSGG